VAVTEKKLRTIICVAVAMQITSIDGSTARCVTKGFERTASLFKLQGSSVCVGGWVLVHVGYSLQVISEAEAQETWGLFGQISAGEDAVA
jgi:hydrogenase expression/formation protein HypC